MARDEHKGKIAWAAAVRNFGEAAARELVKKGSVAPDPKEKDYGDVQPFVDKGRAAINVVNAEMKKAGKDGHLRVSYIAPKVIDTDDTEVTDDISEQDGAE